MNDIINCYLDVLPLGFRELRTMYVSTPKNLDPKHSATKKNMKDFDYVLNHIENNYSGSLRDSSLWYLNICKERLIKQFNNKGYYESSTYFIYEVSSISPPYIIFSLRCAGVWSTHLFGFRA